MTEEAEQEQPPSISTHNLSGNLIAGNHNTINTYNTPRPVASPLFSIPDPPANFTGRIAEIEELLPHFTTQDGRGAAISGLSGGGGVGKSALARVLAARLAEQFPDARIQIDLRGAPHPGQRPLTPEEALQGLLRPFLPTTQLPDDLSALQAILTDTLRGKRALLLLDNASNAAQVRPLIPPAPCAVIITSRTRITLPDLGLSQKALGALRPDEARTLLRTHTLLQSVPDALLDKLARLCGALPLALNVSAALLAARPDWTPQHLLQKLSDERTRLQRLKSPDDPNLDVEASLSLSYNLLDEENQRRFRALGIFPAPFDLPAIAAIWDLSPEAADEALGPLLRLSLVDYVSGERMPYKLHDLTRIYAESLLRREPEEWSAAMQRHANYFLQQGGDADQLYLKGGENVLEGLRRFDVLWPHLQATYERTLPKAGDPQADRWLTNFLCAVVYTFDLRLAPHQKISLIEHSLAAARRLRDRSKEGIHLGNLGLAYADLGEPRRAIELYEQRLLIAREIGDRLRESNALGSLSNAYADLGEPRRAIELYEQQLVIVREIGDRRGEGNALGNLGLAYADLGEPRRAIELYEQQLVIVRKIGDRRGEGNALGSLGVAYKNLGESRRAIKLYEQQLVIVREIGDRRGEDNALGNLGNAYAELGEPRRAIELYEQQLVIVREIGDQRGEAATLGNLGLIYADLGKPHHAIKLHEQQLVIARHIGDQRGEAHACWSTGLLLEVQGEYQRAAELMQVAVDFYSAIGHPQAAGMADDVEMVRKKAKSRE